MDIKKIVEQLKDERRRLEVAIATLEGIETPMPPREIARSGDGRRGRPRGSAMDAATRLRVSEGMRQSWARRKHAEHGNHAEPNSPEVGQGQTADTPN